jgi:hypothetical protein
VKRSINLALSFRGESALADVGLLETVKEQVRMLPCRSMTAIRVLASRQSEGRKPVPAACIRVHRPHPLVPSCVLTGGWGGGGTVALGLRGARAGSLPSTSNPWACCGAITQVVPMWCRAVHSEDGSSVSLQPYGTKDQHINSISRSFLNCVLLDELDRICAGTRR